jgi:hypothetical protein
VPVEEEGSVVLMSSPEVIFLVSDCDSSLSLELVDLEVLVVQVVHEVQKVPEVRVRQGLQAQEVGS